MTVAIHILQWIAADEPSNPIMVIPGPEIVQVRFGVEFSAREAVFPFVIEDGVGIVREVFIEDGGMAVGVVFEALDD